MATGDPAKTTEQMEIPTIPNKHPMLHIKCPTLILSGCSIFSGIDAVWACSQIALEGIGLSKRADISPSGPFQFVRMPCGLSYALKSPTDLCTMSHEIWEIKLYICRMFHCKLFRWTTSDSPAYSSPPPGKNGVLTNASNLSCEAPTSQSWGT